MLLNGGQPNLHDVWLSPGLVHYIYIFGGFCPLTEFYQVQNSLCVQFLHSPMLAALLHSTRAVAISQTLWRGTRNEIAELLQRAPPAFGWAAITLGIGPHSSCQRVATICQGLYCGFVWSCVFSCRWHSSLVVKALDLQLDGCKYNSRPPQLILDEWLSLERQSTSLFHWATQANSASYP